MKALARLNRFSILAALSLACAGCSVEQASNRCAKETTTLDGLIQCARDLHAKTQQCGQSQAGKGALPVAGRRVLKFGDVTNYGGTSKGIVFETAAGAGVQALLAGTVTFADKYRSYGDLVIVDSCSKVTLMAGAFTPDVMAGQSIGAGQSVARMQPASTGAPVLYLEVRENGTAIDPASFIPAS
jgi:septal ring factor EnvC (AmiA/AmiB activator)